MAKTYADSVKLPNLVPIAHPATRLSRNGLNIEGSSSTNTKSTTNLLTHSLDRRSFIVGLLQNNAGNNELNKYAFPRRKQKQACATSDELLAMINDKLTTGYYGVKHLFSTNEVDGRLSKESFKCVLSQLCGYINSETWQKISNRFDLSNGISFSEFISRFENNPKVKKELVTSSNVQLIDISHELVTNVSKKILLPELSATYCLALLKARANEDGFDPRMFLNKSCFENNQLVMPFHLMEVLDSMSLKLSLVEFEKLWNRLDVKNTGCIKTHVFLRLINWRPNQIEEFGEHMDVLRARSCIADEQTIRRILTKRRSRLSQKKRQMLEHESVRENLKSESISYFDRKSVGCGNGNGNKTGEIEVVVDEAVRSKSATAENRADLRTCQTSVSEARIKSMVKNLNMTQRFGFNDDLVVFLNSRLNEGYISMKAAFEYIDPDHLSHLLADEFRYVLNEFNVFFDTDTSYEKFLAKHDLKKHTNLVDYEKFLQIFHDQGPNSVSTSFSALSDKSYTTSNSVNSAEKRIVEFFHGASFLCHSSFKEQNKNLDNPNICSLATLRKLIEQRFSIIISNSQFDKLIAFLNKTDECEKTGVINWTEMLNKFSEINPWKCFKDSCEALSNRRSRLVAGSSLSQRTSKLFRSSLSQKVIKEEKSTEDGGLGSDEEPEEDDGIQVFSSDEDDDKELARLDSSFDEDKAASKEEKVVDAAAEREREIKRAAMKQQKKVQRSIEKVFRKKFHSITKHLAIVDYKKTEKLDKVMFGALMLRVGLKLTAEDLDHVWKDFEVTERVPFSNLCRRFIIPDEFSRLRKVKEEIKRENMLNDELKKSQPKARQLPSLETGLRLKSSGSNSNLSSLNNMESEESLYLIKKARTAVGLNWTEIKKEFLRLDAPGISRIASDRAVDVFQQFHVPLDHEEALDLCRVFCFNRSSHEFDYVRFLKYFKPVTDGDTDDRGIARQLTSQQKQTTNWSNTNATLKRIILRLREKNAGKEATDGNILAKDLSSLKSLFKKFDVGRKGCLSSDELKQVFSHCQVTVDANELYLMQSEFDPELKGVFCYELCIKSLIEKTISND